jgi:hypothetical protein
MESSVVNPSKAPLLARAVQWCMKRGDTGLSQRLQQTIDHLSPGQHAHFAGLAAAQVAANPHQRVTGGVRAGIALAAGLPSGSTLSDILANRSTGKKHAQALATTLQVSLEWLTSGHGVPPLWTMEPATAFVTWSGELHRTFRSRMVAVLDQPDADVDSEVIDLVRPAPAVSGWIADTLGLSPRDQAITWVIKGNHAQLTFAQLVRLNEALGIPALSHPEHLRAGHVTAAAHLPAIIQMRARLNQRHQRYLMPEVLYRRLRRTLVPLAQDTTSRDHEALADALELLIRQAYGQDPERRAEARAALLADTGRTAFTPLAILQSRHQKT